MGGAAGSRTPSSASGGIGGPSAADAAAASGGAGGGSGTASPSNDGGPSDGAVDRLQGGDVINTADLATDGGGAKSPLGANDVSYLFPLPSVAAEIDALLAVDPKMVGPRFLTEAMMTTLLKEGGFTVQNTANELRGLFRVVALRLDPCAGVTVVTNPAACRSEVRLVAQPLALENRTVQARDFAFHLLFQVSRAELDDLLRSLLALKALGQSLAGVALAPHPIMVREGLKGEFVKGVNALIVKHLAPSKLVKVALMTVGPTGDGTIWDFAQFVFQNGALVPKSIAGFVADNGHIVQVSVNSREDGRTNVIEKGRQYGLPTPDPKIGFPMALVDSDQATALSTDALKVGLQRLRIIEDPAQSSVDRVDCGSCHFGMQASTYYQKLLGTAVAATFVAPAGQNVEQSVPANGNGRNIRAFGYLDSQPVISQRVINESARVADWLSNGVR
ncbi:MAG TPA: hypothetical protein VGF45_01075 [Polyangia bacterium]